MLELSIVHEKSIKAKDRKKITRDKGIIDLKAQYEIEKMTDNMIKSNCSLEVIHRKIRVYMEYNKGIQWYNNNCIECIKIANERYERAKELLEWERV